MAPPWSLVIFDNDGVLVDSERLANTVLAGLLTAAGYRRTPEQCIDEFMGGSLARVRRVVEARTGRSLPADFEDRYHAELFARFETDLRPVPGVARLLGALDAGGVAVCVASSGTPQRIARALSVTGLGGYFGTHVFSASDRGVARGKPAPDLFLHAAAAMGAAPSECVVVEDSPLGVEAAVAAGMTVFGYAGLTPADRLGRAHAVVSSMTGLAAALGLGGNE
ncbi:MAG: HAD family hydrolase [Acidimicrobiales bacterium]